MKLESDTTRNGVRVKVWRGVGGASVDAACQCFGLPFRTHSRMDCPNLRKQQRAMEDA